MITKMPTHCGDDTCSSCVIAGDFIFLSHHGGGQDKREIVHQVRATLESMKQTLNSVGATLDDVFREYFLKGAPARTTVVTTFVGENCLCQMDAVAYKPREGQ